MRNILVKLYNLKGGGGRFEPTKLSDYEKEIEMEKRKENNGRV